MIQKRMDCLILFLLTSLKIYSCICTSINESHLFWSHSYGLYLLTIQLPLFFNRLKSALSILLQKRLEFSMKIARLCWFFSSMKMINLKIINLLRIFTNRIRIIAPIFAPISNFFIIIQMKTYLDEAITNKIANKMV